MWKKIYPQKRFSTSFWGEEDFGKFFFSQENGKA